MKNKQEILDEIQQGLTDGVISEDDIKGFVVTQPVAPAQPVAIGTATTASAAPEDDDVTKKHSSAVEVMFYIAGIVLYAAIMSVIIQSWNDGSALLHIFLSAGVGLGLWAIAYYLIKKSAHYGDVANGLTGSLLLTGSLAVITGGYIVTNEIVSGYGEINFLHGAIALAVVGAVHFAFDRLIKTDFTLLIAILLTVAAIPVAIIELLRNVDTTVDVWSVIFILSAFLFIGATRAVVKIYPERARIKGGFDSMATFIILLSTFIATFGEFDLIWMGILILEAFLIFYISIVSKSKVLLGYASVFLTIAVITISFRYFSGYGITASLILATIGLLGSAGIAATIKKKYF